MANSKLTALTSSTTPSTSTFFYGVGSTAGSTADVKIPYDAIKATMTSSGTWTPSITFATTGDLSVSYTTQIGKYSRIGNLAFYHYVVATSAFTHTTAGGALRLNGLPFVCSASVFGIGAVEHRGIAVASSYINVVARIDTNSSYVSYRMPGQNNIAQVYVNSSDVATGNAVRLIGTVVCAV